MSNSVYLNVGASQVYQAPEVSFEAIPQRISTKNQGLEKDTVELSEKKKSGTSKTGIAAGGLTYWLINRYGSRPILKHIIKPFNAIHKTVTPEELGQLKGAITEAFETKGLNKAGVKMVSDLTPIEVPKVVFFENGKFKGFANIIETYSKRHVAKIYNVLATGRNAAFIPKDFRRLVHDMMQRSGKNALHDIVPEKVPTSQGINSVKSIVDTPYKKIPFGKANQFSMPQNTANAEKLNKIAESFKKALAGKGKKATAGVQDIIVHDRLKLTTFHEMGHAINYNFSKFGKALQKMRVAAKPIALAALATALFTRKKEAKPGQELGKVDKTTNFVKDNAGKIAFLAWVPILAEEAMASIRGNKIAKELLSPDLAKKVAKTNKIAWLTYATAAAATGIATWAGVNVKDTIQAKKDAKQA